MANTGDLANLSTPDNYDGTAELYREAPEAAGVFVQIYNAAVFYETADEHMAWGRERFLGPFVGTIGEHMHGIRFRSAAPGVPALVSAHLIAGDDLGVSGSVPNVDVAAGGGVTPLAAGGGGLLVGQIIECAGGNPDPTRLVPCDGAQYLKTDSTYTGLRDYLLAASAAYNFDANHFVVPDKRSRVAIGAGTNVGVGANDGVAEANRRGTKHRHTAHAHGVTDPGHTHQPRSKSGAGGGSPQFDYTPGINGSYVAGGGGAENFVPPLASATGVTINGADGGSGVAADPLDGSAFVAVNFYICFKA